MAVATALACAVAIAACGSEDEGGGGASAGAAAPTATARAASGGADPGAFPDRPQLLLRFAEPVPGWPRSVRRGGARGGYDRTGYALVVPAGAPALRVAAARAVRPATRGVLLETTVRLPPSGAGGLFCRGSGSAPAGYALTVERRGRWAIERFEDGRAQLLDSGRLLRQAAGGTLLRFVCGAAAEGEPLTLGVQVGATPLQFVKDPAALAPAQRSTVGILARSAGGAGATSSFAYFAASLAG